MSLALAEASACRYVGRAGNDESGMTRCFENWKLGLGGVSKCSR